MGPYEMNEETRVLLEQYDAATKEISALQKRVSQGLATGSVDKAQAANSLNAARTKAEKILSALEKHKLR